METSAKLQNDWLMASQSYFTYIDEGKSEEEAYSLMNKNCDKCFQDLKENGPTYLKELSRCDCCARHQTDRPGAVEDQKDYAWNGGSSVYKYDSMECDCTCRHNCRIIVENMNDDK